MYLPVRSQTTVRSTVSESCTKGAPAAFCVKPVRVGVRAERVACRRATLKSAARCSECRTAAKLVMLKRLKIAVRTRNTFRPRSVLPVQVELTKNGPRRALRCKIAEGADAEWRTRRVMKAVGGQ